MNQNFRTPQQGGWIDHNGMIQSSGGSAASQDSFISQVPLPYHLGGQDMSYTNKEINSSAQQPWSYGHEQAIDNRPFSFNQGRQNSVQAYNYGGHFPGSQQLGANMQYGLQRPASQNSNYNPYNDNQAPDLFARGHPFSSGTETQQFHGSRDDYPNQWQTGTQSNGMQGSHYQQNPTAGAQRQYSQAQRKSWNNNNADDTDVQRNAGFFGNGLSDQSYHHPVSLYRRNTHGGPRGSMGMSRQKPGNNLGKNNFDGRNGKKYTSAGGDPLIQSNPLQDGGDYSTNSGASTPVLGIHNKTSTETPKFKTARTQPTPKTARELGQQTPLAVNKSGANSAIVRASSGANYLSCGPPPAFLSEGNSEVSLSSVSSATNMLGHGGRGRSNTQDPFTSGPNAAQLPRSVSTGYGTSSLWSVNKGLGPSYHLLTLCQDGRKPSINVAFDAANMPLVESARTHPNMRQTGLVRVSNIPYSVTRQEILAFFGRNARIIPDNDEPVHIIMERVTSKTMDAFVEFVNIQEAVNAVDRYDTQRALGYGGKLGERWANLEVCGHEVLMQELFPKTTNVKWIGIDPIIETCTDAWNSGFKGFVSREELVMLLKHVETPQRSPFARDCPQRPFECLIGTLLKYPWNRLDVITIGDRDAIHETAVSLCKHLVSIIDSGQHEMHIDARLLRRVKRAVFRCNGFTEAQKDDLAFVFKMTSVEAGLPPYADSWSIFKVIGAKRSWAPDVILYYMALLREATSSSGVLSLAEQSRAGGQTRTLNAFGDVHIEYPADVSKMSLADVGAIEWNMVEALLRKILSAN